jgi:hypothetical protein
MLKSIVNIAVPLKKMLAFKLSSKVEEIFNGYLGDVHLYGDYARTRGEAVRLFHTELDRIIFFDFLDWRIRELDAGCFKPERYLKPEITIIAHSLGSIMSFDALVYAFAKKEIRESSAESVKFSSSFPFFGYTTPFNDGDKIYNKYQNRLDKFIQNVKEPFTKKAINEVKVCEYEKVFKKLYDELTVCNKSEDDKKELLEELNCQLDEVFPMSKWLAQFAFQEQGDVDKVQNYAPGFFDNKEISNRIEVALCEDKKKIKKFIKENLINEDSDDEDKLYAIVDHIDVEAIINNHLENVCNKVEKWSEAYWSTFLDGFCDQDSSDVKLLQQKQKAYPPELDKQAISGIPHLLWRKQVKNFITIGSPIDKYLALWHQNYLHLGLKIKGYTTPARWRFPCECQYEFPESLTSRKIRHYNFCDEQDPVGHHLDMTRRTEVYQQIFDTTDTKRRDVVFRRYGVPGLAHTMYWQDGDLFRGILREILDRKPHEAGKIGTSSFFIRDDFREQKNAIKEGYLWAYFRIPLIASLITGLIIAYGMYAEKPLTTIIAFLFAVTLWIMPGILTFYKDKTSFAGVNKPTFRLLMKNFISSGIFLRLISMAVEWRRILVSQSEGEDDDASENIRLSFQKKGEWWTWWPFVWRWGWRMVAASVMAFVFYVVLEEENYRLLIHYNIPDTLYIYALYVFNLAYVKQVTDLLRPTLIVYMIIMMIVFYQYFRLRIKYAKINKISE